LAIENGLLNERTFQGRIKTRSETTEQALYHATGHGNKAAGFAFQVHLPFPFY
jgi:hypothetical protein